MSEDVDDTTLLIFLIPFQFRVIHTSSCSCQQTASMQMSGRKIDLLAFQLSTTADPQGH